MKGKGKRSLLQNPKLVGAIAVFAGIGLVVVVLMVAQFAGLISIGVISPETPVANSTFSGISYVDGEDCSNFVEGSIWTPKSTTDFADKADIYTLSKFEETEASKDLDDISIDLSSYLYVWLEIDPDGESVFSTNWHLIAPGGANRHHTFYLYDLTSDVNFNLFTRDTMAAITLGDYSTDANVTIIADCDHYTEANIHANSDDWACDDEEWADMSDSEKEEYYDEALWQCQAPLYNPSTDTSKEFDSNLERITDAFAYDFTMNGTISTTDGNAAQVNCTIIGTVGAEVVISGSHIYIIFYEIVDFESGPHALYLEMEFGDDIHCDDLDSVRIVVPRGSTNLGATTKYSDIGA